MHFISAPLITLPLLPCYLTPTGGALLSPQLPSCSSSARIALLLYLLHPHGERVEGPKYPLAISKKEDISPFFPLFLNPVSTPLGPAGPTSPQCSATHPILVLENRSHPSLFHQCFEKQVTAQTGSGMPCTAGQQSFGVGKKEQRKASKFPPSHPRLFPGLVSPCPGGHRARAHQLLLGGWRGGRDGSHHMPAPLRSDR